MSGSAYREFVRFELSYYLRRISTYAYFGILFGLGILLITMLGGLFESVTLTVGGTGGNVLVDSPYVMALLISVTSLFGVIVTAAVMGNAIYRDYGTGIHPLFFTLPISKGAYYGGRFTGALIVNFLIFLGIPAGFALACQLPLLDAERFGAFRIGNFLMPYFTLVVPNLVLTGAIFFTLAALTRKMLPNYVGGVGLLVGYLIASNLTADLENETLAALLDPFGVQAQSLITKYWTVAEKNAQQIPLAGVMLYNRLLWVGVGVLIFVLGLTRFRFSHFARESTRKKKRRHTEAAAGEQAAAPVHAPAVVARHGRAAHAAQYLSLTRQAFLSIVQNVYFYAIAGAGLLFLVLSAPQIGKLYGTTTYPATALALEVLEGTFALFMVVIIAFYSGELVWQERDLRSNQIHDALPVPTWAPFLAKLTALGMVVALLLAVIMVAGIAAQAMGGYFNFEIGLYLQSLFAMSLPDYLLLCVLALLVHTLVNHKYMGHLIIILYFVFTLFMGQLGLEHNLYNYGSDAGRQYSDMNEFGPFMRPFIWFKLYWAAVAVVCALVTNLFWVRGEERSAHWRMRLARGRLTRRVATAAAVSLALIAATGGFIYYNTNMLNEFTTSADEQRRRAEYEKAYKQFEGVPQPRVVAVDLNVAIHPERRDVEIAGEMRLVNRSDAPIDSVHVLLPPEVGIRRLAFDRAATLELEDLRHAYRIFRLATPLAPGDTTVLHLDLAYLTRGFENTVSELSVVENGTFLNSGWLPGIGYDPRAELSSDNVRRKHGLQPKERAAPVDDVDARMNNFISRDADWIDFAATVSTSPDQIALAPGYLQREWQEGGRRFFRYEMDSPILNFYSFLSARYTVKEDRWRDVPIQIYYHAGHEYNLERMIRSVKASLEYFTTAFGPYQHRQVRIVEFPRYATFAQSFPNTIPYSEGIGFIARIADEEKDVDYPFYVTAHEVAHQWWGHQAVGGDVQGAALISETLSQYSALMVMKEEYGPSRMKKFLKYELDQYLIGRSSEQKKEVPLLLAEGQGYIHYNKGSLVMYALQDYIGEERVNAALRRYLEQVRYQAPPYTNSRELLEHLRAETPDSLRYVLEDMFETITLYENRAVRASADAQADGSFLVRLEIEAGKVRADSLGNETDVPMDDWIDVGVFGAKTADDAGEGKELYLARHRVTAGTSTLEIRVSEKPERAGIDPYHKLIDRHTNDNVVTVREGG